MRIRFEGETCPDCLSPANALRVNGIVRCKCGRFARELHEARVASDGNDELVRVVRKKQASIRRVSPERAASRARVCGMLLHAIEAQESLAAEAAAIGVSRTMVGRWCCPESGAAITLGDLLAGRRDVARAVLLAALAQLDEGAARVELGEAVLRLVSDVGRLAGVLGDRAKALRELDTIAGRCAAIRRALEE